MLWGSWVGTEIAYPSLMGNTRFEGNKWGGIVVKLCMDPGKSVESPVATPPASSGISPDGTSGLHLHRELLGGEYWRHVPGFASVSPSEFETHSFQQKHTVTSVPQLRSILGDLVSHSFYEELAMGLRNAPMALRISPSFESD